MKWRNTTNLVISILLSFAYTVVTVLNIIGPLHMNKSGSINNLPKSLFVASLVYWIVSLLLTWFIYFLFKKYPEFLFFCLIFFGIFFIIFQNFVWAWIGS